MASEHLRGLRAVWGDACHSMWIELVALRCTHAYMLGIFSRDRDRLLTEIVYAPESTNRLNRVTPVEFCDRLESYLLTVVVNRVVLLASAFELYFRSFLLEYLRTRPRFCDPNTGGLTATGKKVLGEVTGTRGLVPKIERFAGLTGAKTKSLKATLAAVGDAYCLRNVIAHRAGAFPRRNS